METQVQSTKISGMMDNDAMKMPTELHAREFGRLVGSVARRPATWEYRRNALAYSRRELAKALRWMRQAARGDWY